MKGGRGLSGAAGQVRADKFELEGFNLRARKP